jgi:sugar lactone lactonase YvrE
LTCLVAARALAGGGSALAAEASAANCAPQGGLDYVCGPASVEDLVQVPGSAWILGSGLAERDAPGRIHRIDSRARNGSIAWPADAAPAAHDAKRFPDCATPPDAAKFSAHGLALRHLAAGRDELLVVNHGREAIEFFDVDSRQGVPRLAWKGCVPMPADVYLNSVAALADGGFVATQFYDPGKGSMATILTGAVTGDVLEWHPGSRVSHIAGTSLSGANGIETDGRGRVLYVVAWGSRELLRFDRRGSSLAVRRVALDFAPDNLRWTADHRRLLLAGQKVAAQGSGPVKLEGWRVLRVQPDSLDLETVHDAGADVALQGVSIGLEVEGRLWVGTFRGDRVGSLPLPR